MSADRLARADADFFVCPDNTAHIAHKELAAPGCDAVAVVCTEIPLLVTPDISPLPTLDSTRLLARAALDVATGDRPLPTWRGGPTGA